MACVLLLCAPACWLQTRMERGGAATFLSLLELNSRSSTQGTREYCSAAVSQAVQQAAVSMLQRAVDSSSQLQCKVNDSK